MWARIYRFQKLFQSGLFWPISQINIFISGKGILRASRNEFLIPEPRVAKICVGQKLFQSGLFCPISQINIFISGNDILRASRNEFLIPGLGVA